MTTPAFTADASLYRTSRHYQSLWRVKATVVVNTGLFLNAQRDALVWKVLLDS